MKLLHRCRYPTSAAPGTWIAASECHVRRVPCALDSKGGYLNANCARVEAECRRRTSASAVVDGVPCEPLTSEQPCDWAMAPEALGSMVQALLPGPSDGDYPFKCSTGFVGSSLPHSQTSSLCAGRCPAGSFADRRRRSCRPSAHQATGADGASQPSPCAAGTFSTATGLTSQSQCVVTL